MLLRRKKEKKKSKKIKTKTRSKSSHASSKSGSSSRSKKIDREKKKKTYAELDDWDARGIRCCVCGEKDDSPCDMFEGKKRAWGYAPKLVVKSGRYTTVGKGCLLCTRTQMGWYYPEIKLGDMKEKLGSDPQLHKERMTCFLLGSPRPHITFYNYRTWFVDHGMFCSAWRYGVVRR